MHEVRLYVCKDSSGLPSTLYLGFSFGEGAGEGVKEDFNQDEGYKKTR